MNIPPQNREGELCDTSTIVKQQRKKEQKKKFRVKEWAL